ncbi:MAG: hypothetical protein ACRC2T_12825 [Thermoguttaceae bacterium]
MATIATTNIHDEIIKIKNHRMFQVAVAIKIPTTLLGKQNILRHKKLKKTSKVGKKNPNARRMAWLLISKKQYFVLKNVLHCGERSFRHNCSVSV